MNIPCSPCLRGQSSIPGSKARVTKSKPPGQPPGHAPIRLGPSVKCPEHLEFGPSF